MRMNPLNHTNRSNTTTTSTTISCRGRMIQKHVSFNDIVEVLTFERYPNTLSSQNHIQTNGTDNTNNNNITIVGEILNRIKTYSIKEDFYHQYNTKQDRWEDACVNTKKLQKKGSSSSSSSSSSYATSIHGNKEVPTTTTTTTTTAFDRWGTFRRHVLGTNTCNNNNNETKSTTTTNVDVAGISSSSSLCSLRWSSVLTDTKNTQIMNHPRAMETLEQQQQQQVVQVDMPQQQQHPHKDSSSCSVDDSTTTNGSSKERATTTAIPASSYLSSPSKSDRQNQFYKNSSHTLRDKFMTRDTKNDSVQVSTIKMPSFSSIDSSVGDDEMITDDDYTTTDDENMTVTDDDDSTVNHSNTTTTIIKKVKAPRLPHRRASMELLQEGDDEEGDDEDYYPKVVPRHYPQQSFDPVETTVSPKLLPQVSPLHQPCRKPSMDNLSTRSRVCTFLPQPPLYRPSRKPSLDDLTAISCPSESTSTSSTTTESSSMMGSSSCSGSTLSSSQPVPQPLCQPRRKPSIEIVPTPLLSSESSSSLSLLPTEPSSPMYNAAYPSSSSSAITAAPRRPQRQASMDHTMHVSTSLARTCSTSSMDSSDYSTPHATQKTQPPRVPQRCGSDNSDRQQRHPTMHFMEDAAAAKIFFSNPKQLRDEEDIHKNKEPKMVRSPFPKRKCQVSSAGPSPKTNGVATTLTQTFSASSKLTVISQRQC